MFSTLSPSPFTPPVRPPTGQGENGLPDRENILALWENVGGDLTESIGLSSTDYDFLTTDQQTFFFTDPSTPKTWATFALFWAAISVQSWFNDENIMGTETKGVAVYPNGTTAAVLKKAYRWFGITFHAYWQRVDFSFILRTDGSKIEVFT